MDKESVKSKLASGLKRGAKVVMFILTTVFIIVVTDPTFSEWTVETFAVNAGIINVTLAALAKVLEQSISEDSRWKAIKDLL